MKDTKLIQFLDSMVPPLFDSMKFVFPQVKGEMRHRESFFGMPQSILLRQNMPIPDSCRCKYIIAADTNWTPNSCLHFDISSYATAVASELSGWQQFDGSMTSIRWLFWNSWFAPNLFELFEVENVKYFEPPVSVLVSTSSAIQFVDDARDVLWHAKQSSRNGTAQTLKLRRLSHLMDSTSMYIWNLQTWMWFFCVSFCSFVERSIYVRTFKVCWIRCSMVTGNPRALPRLKYKENEGVSGYHPSIGKCHVSLL